MSITVTACDRMPCGHCSQVAQAYAGFYALSVVLVEQGGVRVGLCASHARQLLGEERLAKALKLPEKKQRRASTRRQEQRSA